MWLTDYPKERTRSLKISNTELNIAEWISRLCFCPKRIATPLIFFLWNKKFGLVCFLSLFFPIVFWLMACVYCAWSTHYDSMVLRCLTYLPYEYFPLVPSSTLPSLFRFGSKCKATDLYQVCNFMLISSIVWPLVSYTECVKHRFDRFHLRNHRRKYF